MSGAVATMWLLLLLLCCSPHQLLIVQAVDRTVLMGMDNPCKGYIGIVHNGQLGYVGGGERLNDHASKVVCSSIQCGNVSKTSPSPAMKPIDTFWMDTVNCTGKEAQLWECKFPGFGVSYTRRDALQYIECSHEIKIGLDGFECAGAVQYSVDGGQNYLGYICDDGWEKKDADFLCKTLNCGTAKEVVKDQWMGWKAFPEKKKMMIKCSEIINVSHLWQCATKESSSCKKPASVICTGHERVQLKRKASVCSGQLEKEESGAWTTFQKNQTKISPDKLCQQMHCGTSGNFSGTNLTCSDNVKVVLMDNNKASKCYGTVTIQVNNITHHVCGSSWNIKDAEVVCRELDCGKVHHNKIVQGNKNGIMDNVWCSGNEASLWHCRAKRDHTAFKCPSHVYVVCAGSFEVKLADGPGNCSGRVEIQHEGKWKRVNEQGWSDENFDAVCKLLNCGNKREPLKEFSQGSAEFLNHALRCKKNTEHISECVAGAANMTLAKAAMAITCEEHKVVFLKGKESCSGMVGVEQDPKTYWLSGSNGTWNADSANAVCQQMHCGKASNYTHTNNSVEAVGKSIWKESYSCAPNTTSLFACQKNLNQSSDHNDTIASVTCSGKRTANLTNRCWGNVNVCLGNKCGGVCSKGWTKLHAVTLCEDLGCGRPVLEATPIQPNKSHVIIKSVHSTNETTNLTQCNFVTTNENDITCTDNPAFVVCSGSITTKFSDLSDNCSGSVEMHYVGTWRPVCAEALKEKKVQDTICGELKCGQSSKLIDYFGPKAVERLSISKIDCNADGDKSLAACSMTSQMSSCNPGVLECTGWSKLALTVGKACQGYAIVLSKTESIPISFEGLTERMGNMLCTHLGCGRLKQNNSYPSISSLESYFNCATMNSESIWDCERKVSSNMNNTIRPELLSIECEDEPNITLSKKCHGEVMINNLEVCATNWTQEYSDRVCSETNCGGKAIYSPNDGAKKANKEYYHLRCDEHHYQLGQCKKFKERCRGPLVSVFCVDNVKFRTTEKCGGQIEVQYRDRWEKVCAQKKPVDPKMLCPEIDCSGPEDFKADNNLHSSVSKVTTLETSLNCTDDVQNIKYCLHHQQCESEKPAEIICKGYKQRRVEPPKNTTPVWPIILAVGFALVVVILIVVLRICIVRKAKKGKNVSRVAGNLEEDGLESGNYEEVISKSNEMEELNPRRFQSETEADAASISSFAYDDIDEVAVVQPLTSVADPAEASGDYMQNGATIEVDDQEENYDDIEACYEITQIEAEIHDATRTAAECDAAAPPGSELGGDNNLVQRRVSQS